MTNVERYQQHTTWDVLQAQAGALAKSGFVPAQYRGKPDDILAAGLYGDAIGLPITAALSYIDVMNGKPTLKPEGMLALVRARGHVVAGQTSAIVATVTGKRRDTGEEMTVEWTWDMAEKAGLPKKNPTWHSYPQAMLWARAVSQLCRMLFSDIILGISYTPEEMGDVIDIPTPAMPAPAAAPVLEEAPPPLQEVSQASPAGGSESLFIDTDTGEAHNATGGAEEQERRRLVADMLAATKKLSTEQRQAFDTWRMAAKLSLTKVAKDHTKEELQLINEWLDNTLGAPF